MFLQKFLYFSYTKSNNIELNIIPTFWELKDGIISNKYSNWEYTKNNLLKHVDTLKYICCDLEYNIYLSNNVKHAIPFSFSNNSLIYNKPKLRYDFDILNVAKSIPEFVISQKINGMKVCILLAGGLSTRFKDSHVKQLFKINNKPVIEYSMDILDKIMDIIIIVTNSTIQSEILELIEYRPKFKLIINDINCRLKSIETALIYIRENYDLVSNIIIHDSARPFIKSEHIIKLQTNYENGFLYSQYYLKLVNGLLKKDTYTFETVDRDEFLEICTPVCIDFELFYFLFMNYIADPVDRIVWEIIPLLDLMKIEYDLIEDHIKYLRKITTIDDVF